jgi:hypothetical protein
MTEAKELPGKKTGGDCWIHISGLASNNYGAKPAPIHYDSETKPTDVPDGETGKDADAEALDIIVQNPEINASTLLNTIKAKGLKIVDAKPATGPAEEPTDPFGMEADSASSNTASLRTTLNPQTKKKNESITFAPGKKPIKESDKFKETSNLNFRSCKFLESSSADDGVGPTRFKTVLLQEGLGNLRDTYYYSRQALESAIPVFEGKKIYADHPSAFDEETRPERSVKDVLGHFQDIHIEEDADGRAMLVGDVMILDDKPYEWARGLMTHAVTYSKKYPDKEFVGLSINASGDAHEIGLDQFMKENKIPESAVIKLMKAKDEGVESIKVVMEIKNAVSCDLVTEAGAGGKILEMLEKEKKAMAKKKVKESDEKHPAGAAEAEKKEAMKKEAEEKKEADEKKEASDGAGDSGHDDAAQDKELVKKMLKKHGVGGADDGDGEQEYEAYQKGFGAATEAGMDKEEAADHVVKAMKMANIMKDHTDKEEEKKENEKKEAFGKKDDDGDADDKKESDDDKKEADEKKESEDEAKKEADDGDKKESEVITLRGRVAMLESKLKAMELTEYLETKLKKSGLSRETTRLFREGLGTPKSKDDVDSKFKLFTDAYKAGSGEASGFVISTEKSVETEGGLSFSDCKN